MEIIRVLFLCTGNSARSQMAEALLRKHGEGRFETFSAGLEPTRVNPFTVKVLQEIGIDTSGLFSKPLSDFAGKRDFDFLITVCSNAEQRCPVFPGAGKRLHWPFEDPAALEGTDEEKTRKFREIRGQIETRIREWMAASER